MSVVNELEREITYHHSKCDITYTNKSGVVFLQVNDLVIYDGINEDAIKAFENINLDCGLEKAYDKLVRSPQLITSRDYYNGKFITDQSISNARYPSFELLRGLGIKIMNYPIERDYNKDSDSQSIEAVTRSYSGYEEVDWVRYEYLYSIEHTANGYKVRGVFKDEK